MYHIARIVCEQKYLQILGKFQKCYSSIKPKCIEFYWLFAKILGYRNLNMFIWRFTLSLFLATLPFRYITLSKVSPELSLVSVRIIGLASRSSVVGRDVLNSLLNDNVSLLIILIEWYLFHYMCISSIPSFIILSLHFSP